MCTVYQEQDVSLCCISQEMRHFESLEEKLSEMVEKQRRREEELDSVVKQKQSVSRSIVDDEVDKWRRVVDTKNQQVRT